MIRIDLPFTSPPLSLNDRHHWAKRNRLNRTVRDITHALARNQRLDPIEVPVVVTLHYRQRVKRRIDKDNLYATIKPAIDGLRDAGVLAEDDHTRVDPRIDIHPPIPGQPGAMWLELSPP